MPFQKGRSGNPAGRKKGTKDKSPRAKSRLVHAAVEEAVRSVPDDLTSCAQVQAAVIPILADLIDPDRALRELAALAYGDVRELFDEHGNLKPLHQLPAHVAAMIGGVEVLIKNAEAGDGKTDRVHKIKIWDKPKALQMLLTNLGLLIEKKEISHTVSEATLSRLDAWKSKR